MKMILKALQLQFFKSVMLQKKENMKLLCHNCLVSINSVNSHSNTATTTATTITTTNNTNTTTNNNNVQPHHRIHTPMNLLSTRFRPLSFVYEQDAKDKHPTGHNEATNGMCKLCFQRQ